jgi:dTDP-4-amino-4,6-dideoxygalactose transaminase
MTAADDEPIPLVDLAWQHAQIATEVEAGFRSVMERTAFVKGSEVAEFEAAFAAYCGVGQTVGVANGTEAIELALRACAIGPGDLVVLPANTFIATAEAVERAGAGVVLVDCDPVHLLIDPALACDRAGDAAVRAVIGVDLYGQCAPLEELRQGLDGRALVIEDAAQSQGATRHGAGIGTLAPVAATSFYPGKNLGAYGDGGAVLTDDPDLADRVRVIAEHGSRTKYHHEVVGLNSRLDTLQAVVLLAKLRRLDAWNALRRSAAGFYLAALAVHPEVTLPAVADGNEHVWHLFPVRIAQRDRVAAALQRAGVGTAIHYPVPVHLQPAFAHLGHGPGAFPNAEAAAGELLSLPMYPGISEGQQSRVVEALLAAIHDPAT